MWITSLFVGVAVALASAAVDQNAPLERRGKIEIVNEEQTTWTSHSKYFLGLKKHPDGSRLPEYIPDEDLDNLELPKNFDLRTVYPNCTGLQTVRDQGSCGSCWAVATAAVFTDRLCIASKGSWNGQLSAENLLSCCTDCGVPGGCNGGDPEKAFEYFVDTGIVTGGDFDSHEGCQPYTMPACEHHVDGTRKNCSSYEETTPECKKTCYNKEYTTKYKEDLHYVMYSFKIKDDVNTTMKEIYINGPVVAEFLVFEDFENYTSGIYTQKTGKLRGGHAVKIIGWGEESGTNYWLVANSWNSDWGDKGFFKILRGANECGFEENIIGGSLIVK